MKIRLLVMNGQRLVQTDSGNGEWNTQKVDKANGVRAGVYNLFMAQAANKAMSYTGAIIYADNSSIYQQVGKQFITHKLSDFGKNIPDIGEQSSISYDVQGKALVADVETLSLKKGLRL